MKFLHTSDLHLGKRVFEFSMLEDQAYILEQILEIAIKNNVDAIIIAGDIYDKSIPPASAVELFDEYLVKWTDAEIKVFIISGNHDSPERIAFGGRLMEEKGVYVSPVYQRDIKPVIIRDEIGDVNVYLLPFIKPIHVRDEFPEEKIESYNQAVDIAVRHLNIDLSKRNILVTHQFVTGAVRSESEDISVGGTDNVNAEAFSNFDYVALGHIHSMQCIKEERIRYSGTPLKYSFSEVNHEKNVTIADLKEKGDLDIKPIILMPKRDMQSVKGSYAEVIDVSIYEKYSRDSYVHVTLTDEVEVPEVMTKLRRIFPNVMKMDYDNTRTRINQEIQGVEEVEKKLPIQLFETLYEKQNNNTLKDVQIQYLEQIIGDIWGEKL